MAITNSRRSLRALFWFLPESGFPVYLPLRAVCRRGARWVLKIFRAFEKLWKQLMKYRLESGFNGLDAPDYG